MTEATTATTAAAKSAGTSSRRIGAESSKTRAQLLDAAQDLMLEEGYAAVTSRKLAARAGLKPQLVHYYFRTMDDLFLALFRRGADLNRRRLERALSSPQPLRALWRFASDRAGTALMLEFGALSNHRKAIGAELAAYSADFRERQTEVVAKVLSEAGIGADELPPIAVPVLMTGISQVMGIEASFGTTTGHDDALALVERLLDRLEPRVQDTP
jgi:AcrR family transcriptional regulator